MVAKDANDQNTEAEYEEKTRYENRCWELYQDYRRRIRQYAWLTIVGVPAAYMLSVEKVNTLLNFNRSTIELVTFLSLTACSLLTIVAANGIESYKNKTGQRPRDETPTGRLAGIVQPGIYAFIVIIEAIILLKKGNFSLWWLLCFLLPLIYYYKVTENIKEKSDKIKSIELELAKSIYRILIIVFFILLPITVLFILLYPPFSTDLLCASVFLEIFGWIFLPIAYHHEYESSRIVSVYFGITLAFLIGSTVYFG